MDFRTFMESKLSINKNTADKLFFYNYINPGPNAIGYETAINLT